VDNSIKDLIHEVAQAVASEYIAKVAPVAPRFLTPEQVTLYCGFPVKTLAWWRVKRVGPPYIKVANKIRYELAELDAWLRSSPDVPEA